MVSNSNKFDVLSNNDWISVNKPNNEVTPEISFSVSTNPEKASREGSISILVDGQEKATLTVTQKGSISFILPSFLFGSPTSEIKDFESKRKHSPKEENDTGTGTILKYNVVDDLFGEIYYLINLNRYVKSTLYVKGGVISEENKKNFEEFLINNGFKAQQEMGFETSLSLEKIEKTVFIDENRQAKIEFMNDKNTNHYTVTYFPHQNADFQTLSALPIFNKGISKEAVEAYESENGGTYNHSASVLNRRTGGYGSDYLVYDVNQDHLIARSYYVYFPNQRKTGLTQIRYFYDRAELALYQGLDGNYYPTREFIALAQNEGFTFSGNKNTSGSWIFSNSSTKRTLLVQWRKNSNFNWVLQLDIF